MPVHNLRLTAWRNRIQLLDVSCAHSCGALWTGLGAESASKVASSRGLTTLEMTMGGARLHKGPERTMLDSDFGPDWGMEKRQVWSWLSQRFARELSGHVRILVRTGELTKKSKAELARVRNKILWDELMELDIVDALKANTRVSGITVIEVTSSGIPSFVYPIPLTGITH